MTSLIEAYAAGCNGSSSLVPANANQLQRSLNGITRAHWSMNNSLALFACMIRWPNLQTLDTLSSSNFKMADT
jgi:hypothetical protein